MFRKPLRPVASWMLLTGLLLSLALSGCGSGKADDEFQIQGQIDNYPKNRYIYLDQLFPDRMDRMDSVYVEEDGSFSFKRLATPGGFYHLRLPTGYSFPFIPQADAVELTADYENPSAWSITANRETIILKDFLSKRGALFKAYNQEKQALKLIPKVQQLERWREAEKRTDLALITFRDYMRNFIDTVSVPELRAFAVFSTNIDANYYFLESIYGRLQNEIPDHPYTAGLAQSLRQFGDPFVRIEPQDVVGEGPAGEERHLKDEVGKVTLVYFWASYCAYSRMESAALRDLYQRYEDQGFSIYAISIDDDRAAWQQAIREDSLDWPAHIWLPDQWENQIFADWGVPSVPTTFLLDHRGVIMSKNVRAAELERDLPELLERYLPKSEG